MISNRGESLIKTNVRPRWTNDSKRKEYKERELGYCMSFPRKSSVLGRRETWTVEIHTFLAQRRVDGSSTNGMFRGYRRSPICLYPSSSPSNSLLCLNIVQSSLQPIFGTTYNSQGIKSTLDMFGVPPAQNILGVSSQE